MAHRCAVSNSAFPSSCSLAVSVCSFNSSFLLFSLLRRRYAFPLFRLSVFHSSFICLSLVSHPTLCASPPSVCLLSFTRRLPRAIVFSVHSHAGSLVLALSSGPACAALREQHPAQWHLCSPQLGSRDLASPCECASACVPRSLSFHLLRVRSGLFCHPPQVQSSPRALQRAPAALFASSPLLLQLLSSLSPAPR